MLSCEMAHRANPDMLERVWAYNTFTFKLKEHPAFAEFAQSLELSDAGWLRLKGASFLLRRSCRARWMPSSTIKNPQNYVYYEALYGGYDTQWYRVRRERIVSLVMDASGADAPNGSGRLVVMPSSRAGRSLPRHLHGNFRIAEIVFVASSTDLQGS